MKTIRALLLILTLVAAVGWLCPSSAVADIVTMDLIVGQDSGWSVTYDNSVVDIAAGEVSLAGDYLVIEIWKNFLLPPNQVTGQFPPILIDFIQRLPDAATVGTIRIGTEKIVNATGVDWTDFHWEVLDHSNAWFDVAASTTFGIQPLPQFQSQHWTTRVLDPNAADALDVFDGLVADGTSYLPGRDGSELVIQTSLGGASPVSFTLKQYPTPEPATIALMGIGLAAVFARRSKPQQG